MHEKLILRLTVFGFITILPGAAQKPQLETSRPAVEQIVHQYILQHPEVLMESVRLYQERERAGQKERSKEAIAARLKDVQPDPSSPVAGPAGGATVVEFFDYQCGYFKRAEPTIMKLLADHPDVR